MSEDTLEPNEKDPNWFEKTREVIKNNWKPFAVGAVLTGATYIVAKRISTTNTSIPSLPFYVSDSARKRLGRPSNIVMDLTTREMWGSQGATARARGISDSTLSKHLTRETSDIHGHTYAVVGRLYI